MIIVVIYWFIGVALMCKLLYNLDRLNIRELLKIMFIEWIIWPIVFGLMIQHWKKLRQGYSLTESLNDDVR